VTQHHAAT